jgi:cold-inducible RNA-binding protein
VESKLYVGNIAYTVSEHQLRELFSQAGDVKEVTMILDPATQQTRGFSFVEMATPEAAQKAIEMLDNQEFEGRRIKVSLARPREDRGGGGGGGGYRGESSGGSRGGRSGGGGYGRGRRY